MRVHVMGAPWKLVAVLAACAAPSMAFQASRGLCSTTSAHFLEGQKTQLSAVPSLPQLFLADASDSITMDTFNALNGIVIEDSTVGGAGSTDGLILVASGVAVIALLGLVGLQFIQMGDEKKPQSETTVAPISTTSTPTFTAEAKSVSVAQEALDSTPEIDVKTTPAEVETIEQSDDVEEANPKNALRPDSSPFFASPDKYGITQRVDVALTALNDDDRPRLLAALGRLIGLLRAARVELKRETQLRQDAERKVAILAEESRDLEDKFELEQTKVASTSRKLVQAQSSLGQTESRLRTTTAHLEELQEERQSLRKLGGAAWRLTKDRVRNRVGRLGRKKEES
ncbi:expressed unknown protein [Seminavis robusta]|uniref:Uncharacterized protein n=1 Tax=Seminavis robusta TaxID=568900 RepID=A0A9N8DF13_9STRA|nr:expressed unknown protein [Seminavis robusta]|eukprot:Sro39_g024280.1 n/a (342) ;mRNA; r:127384-128409